MVMMWQKPTSFMLIAVPRATNVLKTSADCYGAIFSSLTVVFNSMTS